MTEGILGMAAHLRRRLAQALESGTLDSDSSEVALRSLGLQSGAAAVLTALEEFERLGIDGRAAAAWIRALEAAALQVHRPDLVWSGPEVPGVHARDTRAVYEELLNTATRSVWLSTFVYYDGPRAFGALARRMETIASLRATLLLNIQRRRGDTTDATSLVQRFADQFWDVDWPGTSRPSVYYDPRSLDLAGPEGVLHAKAVITDEQSVFVTSANLTEAALDRNFELGLLVRDGALAVSVITHFQRLIDERLLSPLPN